MKTNPRQCPMAVVDEWKDISPRWHEHGNFGNQPAEREHGDESP